ncbi:hypothetical protein PGB90_001784 [Kerria lacca]
MEYHLIDNYDHVNEFILYTEVNIPGRGCDINLFNSQISSFCSCKYGCNDVNICFCLKYRNKNYTNKKLMLTDLSNNNSCIECNNYCQCDVYKCENRVVQFGPNANLKIEKFPGKGYGLISKNGMQKGEFVCEYAGEVIGKQEAVERRKRDNTNYIFILNEKSGNSITETIIDATCIANIGRYINHSCDPNCIVIPVRVNSVIPKLAIFSCKDIEIGEEITYSYNGSNLNEIESTILSNRKLCLCASKICLKYLPYNP